MKKIVYITLVVDESDAEDARAELFDAAQDSSFNVLDSGIRNMTKNEVKDAKVIGLIE